MCYGPRNIERPRGVENFGVVGQSVGEDYRSSDLREQIWKRLCEGTGSVYRIHRPRGQIG